MWAREIKICQNLYYIEWFTTSAREFIKNYDYNINKNFISSCRPRIHANALGTDIN